MEYDLSQYGNQAAQAVTDYRAATNPHWNDSYLNMGAQLAIQAMENDYNMKLWNLNNEYNTPAAQMARFKSAGLNPNLIYQQGNPGNSSSPAAASHANFTLSPHKDIGTRIANIAGLVNMITNLAGNVSQMVGQSYDTALKRNELAWSNTELASAASHIVGFGDRNAIPKYRTVDITGPDGSTIDHFQSRLNPYSPYFSPLEYNTLYRLGKIPAYFTGQMTGQAAARLSQLKGDYQDYYTNELLPLFKQYQQGKVNIQDITEELLRYNQRSLEALPPEIRGIMQPLMWLISLQYSTQFRR